MSDPIQDVAERAFEEGGRVAPELIAVAEPFEVVDLNALQDVIKTVDLDSAPVREAGMPIAKRALDLVLCTFGVILSAPLWAAVALSIRLDDGGPVFYRQARWGKDGVPFDLFKFRTMKIASDPAAIRQAAREDKRVTRVGRFLRRTGMDELPQLVNILKGDMSLVGPRALAVGEILLDVGGRATTYEDVPGFSERLLVRPGLTGMATIYIPKDAVPAEKLMWDLRYIREHSLSLDIKLVALSIWISLRGRWETREPKV